MAAPRIAAALTIERACELLHLDPDTGHLTWRAGRRAGRRAGSPASNGYRQIKVDREMHLEHRVVWLLWTGAWPALSIDHINRDKADNRPANLRDVSAAENAHNLDAERTHSKSGLLGVTWEKGTLGRRRGRWVAQIKVDGTLIRLGRFDDEREAHAAYLEAKRRLHAGCLL